MNTKHPLLAPKAPKRMAHNDTISKESERRVVRWLDREASIMWVTSRGRSTGRIKRNPMSVHWANEFYSLFRRW